jgi:PPM family protein phosphatase
MRLEVGAATHAGRRNTNADAYAIDEVANFFAVADGMGDTPRSAIVARMALDAVGELFLAPWASYPPAERSASEAAQRLQLGLVQAHGRLYAPGRSKEQSIGTTFAGVVSCGGRLCLAHVGNSRVYLLGRSKARLAPLTADHTILGDAIYRGMPYDRAAALPNAHAVTRMLGVTSSIEVEVGLQRWEPGDVVLICTDGVSDRVELDELAGILLDVENLVDAARAIVARAIDAGGWDNATALLVRKPG